MKLRKGCIMIRLLASSADSLIDSNLADASTEVAEPSLNGILNSQAIENTLVLKSVVGIGKTRIGVQA